MNLKTQNAWCERFYLDVKELFPSAAPFVDRGMHILNTKGVDYTPEDIAFLDVHYVAHGAGVTPEQVLFALVQKQWTAVRRFVKTRTVETESIHFRLLDVANYAALMDCLIGNRAMVLQRIMAEQATLFPCEYDPLCACAQSDRPDVSSFCGNCQFQHWLTVEWLQLSTPRGTT